MRVSLPIVICSCLLITAISWWLGTRGRDFMEPPSDAELKQIRMQVEQATPPIDQTHNAVSAPGDRQRNSPVAVVLPADLERSPQLDDYVTQARQGSDYLIEIARLLESGGHPQRALLCWERVVDSTKPDKSQLLAALSAIRKLRQQVPVGNGNETAKLSIVLHAGTGSAAAARISGVLDLLAQELQAASCGMLGVKAEVAAGSEDLSQDGATPVAFWISGAEADSPSTDIVSFSVSATSDIRLEVYKSAYRVVRNHITRELKLSAPAIPGDDDDPLKTLTRGLEGTITRLAWQRLGQSLNPSQ